MLVGIVAVIAAVLMSKGGFMASLNGLAQISDPEVSKAPGIFASFFGPDPLGLLFVVILTSLGTWAVSYTHLDVYKRQASFRVTVLPITSQNTCPISSYTKYAYAALPVPLRSTIPPSSHITGTAPYFWQLWKKMCIRDSTAATLTDCFF